MTTFEDNHRKLYALWTTQEFFANQHADIDDLLVHLRGNCTDRAAVMHYMCEGSDVPTQIAWVRMHGVPHLVVVERATGLVSDQTLATMRTVERRLDLAEWRDWTFDKQGDA